MRERSKKILELAKRNHLRHFDVDMTKFAETAYYVVSIIKVGGRIVQACDAKLTPNPIRETMLPTFPPFPPTADGSTSKSAGDLASINSCRPGRYPLTHRNDAED